jgi:hypothetical protein
MFQMTKNIVKALIIIALFLFACSFSLDHVLNGAGVYSQMIQKTPILGGLHLFGIVAFWLVVFLIPDWKIFGAGELNNYL